ncbi:LLM class flavin-dependent oxidoreductase [Dactylosporangium darangshiense]|uniref:5,10-methylenetetrahydromethanopterin reductase n=1 Tax=Dactylosporangium darangshiense TaxID=579108 RepID=A0ABP8DD04_9ACTN
MDKTLRIGVASLVERPMPELAAQAARLESLGYDQIWVPDERLLRNVYVALATIATATSRIGLATGVTNPYTRHPAMTAAAIATIDELSGGRASLGLGAGGGLDAFGIDRPSPVKALRETTAIVRALTGGERFTAREGMFPMDAGLNFTSSRRVPVYLAARGPKILRLAGEIADGVVIGGFARPEGIDYARRQVAQGLERSGRTWSDLDVVSWLYVSVDDDAEKARVAVAKIVLASLVTSRPILDQLGVDLPGPLRDHLDRTGWAFPALDAHEAAALLSPGLLDTFAVYGTPDDCVRRLREIRECGIDHLTCVLFAPSGSTVDDVAERLAESVLPALR